MYCTSGLLAYPPRMGALSDSVYPSSPYATPSGQGYMSLGTESSAFYTPLGNDTPDAWRSLSQTSVGSSSWHYDSSMCGYSYGTSYGSLDVRRKNATRESTSTLKAWLYEHIKNPYPTKGEKIMLAIITKMTLTQVSTWFANARRRLKKENKMQWSPRNRTENDDNDKTSSDDDDDETVSDGKDVGCQKRTNAYDNDDDVVVDSTRSQESTNPVKLPSDFTLVRRDPPGPFRGPPPPPPPPPPAPVKYAFADSPPIHPPPANHFHPSKPAGIEPGPVKTHCPLAPCAASGSVGASTPASSSDHLFCYPPVGGCGGKTPRSPNRMFSRSVLDVTLTEDSTEMKPRIWSLADVATSRPNHHHHHPHHRHSVAASGGHVTLPWTRGVGYVDDDVRATSRFTTMTSYQTTGGRHLPVGGGVGGRGVDSTMCGVQRLPTSGQYSCRLTDNSVHDNLDKVMNGGGQMTATGERGVTVGSCTPPCAPPTELVGALGANAARYHPPAAHSIGDTMHHVTGSTAFKPFPKRIIS